MQFVCQHSDMKLCNLYAIFHEENCSKSEIRQRKWSESASCVATHSKWKLLRYGCIKRLFDISTNRFVNGKNYRLATVCYVVVLENWHYKLMEQIVQFYKRNREWAWCWQRLSSFFRTSTVFARAPKKKKTVFIATNGTHIYFSAMQPLQSVSVNTCHSQCAVWV